jgi:hypothetical protein
MMEYASFDFPRKPNVAEPAMSEGSEFALHMTVSSP